MDTQPTQDLTTVDLSNVVTDFQTRRKIRSYTNRRLDCALFQWEHEHACAVSIGIRKPKDLLPEYKLLLLERRRREGKANKFGKR